MYAAEIALNFENNTTLNRQETLLQTFGKFHSPQAQAMPKGIFGYEVPCGVRRVENRVRIVGGSNAKPGEFPWQASVQLQSFPAPRHVCGGVVLSSSWAITAGHCVQGLELSRLSVLAGEWDLLKEEGFEQRRRIVRLVIRPDADVVHFRNDLAMLQLDSPLVLGTFVSPVCLPDPTDTHVTGQGIVTGWGRLSESGSIPVLLQHVELPILPLASCQQKLTAMGYGAFIHPQQLCLGYPDGGRDSCQGDSGGPLICRHPDSRYYLCGLVGWGVGCARPDLPGIYTEIAPYSQWIKSILYNENHVLGKLDQLQLPL